MDPALEAILAKSEANINDKAVVAPDPAKVSAADVHEIISDTLSVIDAVKTTAGTQASTAETNAKAYAEGLINAVKAGVATDGDTLAKLRALILNKTDKPVEFDHGTINGTTVFAPTTLDCSKTLQRITTNTGADTAFAITSLSNVEFGKEVTFRIYSRRIGDTLTGLFATEGATTITLNGTPSASVIIRRVSGEFVGSVVNEIKLRCVESTLTGGANNIFDVEILNSVQIQDFTIEQFYNRISLPVRMEKLEILKITVPASEASVTNYRLYKQGVAGTLRTSLTDINSDLVAATATDIANGSRLDILFTLVAGKTATAGTIFTIKR